MSKIICEICGTAYPETASQCPICGCAKPENPQVISDDSFPEAGADGAHAYVKGGRFSKSNVKKRNRAAKAQHHDQTAENKEMPRHSAPRRPDKKDEGTHGRETPEREPRKSNHGLMIAAIVLLLAVLAVGIYIGACYFLPDLTEKPEETTQPVVTTEAPATEATEAPTTLPACTDLLLNAEEILLTESGQAWLLNVTPVPETAGTPVVFQSQNPTVASINEEGRITAINEGETVIAVICGDVYKEVKIVCDFTPEEATKAPETTAEVSETKETAEATESDEPEETQPAETKPAETKPQNPEAPEDGLHFVSEDFTLKVGEEWLMYDKADNNGISTDLIYWYSGDENVVVISGGFVKGVGPGDTYIYGQYNGQTFKAIARCRS